MKEDTVKTDLNAVENDSLYQPFRNVKRGHIMEEFSNLTKPYRQLLSYYQCALMETETKFRVLSQEMSLEYDRNPIETIKSRIKSNVSIAEKLRRKHLDPTPENLEKHLKDVAGIRIICAFPSDIYTLVEAFTRQDDVRVLECKDYIKNPKPNGYRSLHLIIEIPIFLYNQKKLMKVEVQFRTIAMDWWAALDHKLSYKKNIDRTADLESELLDCATKAAELDMRMDQLRKQIEMMPDLD